jgi:hypothetical protein
MGNPGPINQCGDLMERWLVGLNGAALSCRDVGAWDSTGAFPERVGQQSPMAKPIKGSGDHSTLRDRQIAAIAVAVARGVLLHSGRPPTDHGRGLRGGTWRFNGGTDTSVDLAYHGIRWTRDLRFSGTAHLEFLTTRPSGGLPTSLSQMPMDGWEGCTSRQRTTSGTTHAQPSPHPAWAHHVSYRPSPLGNQRGPGRGRFQVGGGRPMLDSGNARVPDDHGGCGAGDAGDLGCVSDGGQGSRPHPRRC